MPQDEEFMLSARQYKELYCKAFARLDDVVRQAQQAMEDLEELQLSMGDSLPARPPHRRPRKKNRKKFPRKGGISPLHRGKSMI